VQTALVEAAPASDRCLSHRALVRYDAYVDAGGRQSTRSRCSTTSAAELVVSAIHGPSYARIYVKDVSLGSPADVGSLRRSRRRSTRACGGDDMITRKLALLP